MTELRTTDLTYGADYWNTLDGGLGYQDSVMWEDLAFIIHHTFAQEGDRDAAGDLPHVDVGCAMGYLIRHMRRRGFESFGLEYSDYAISHAPDDVRELIRPFDLTSPDDSVFGRKRFRLLTCFETLEHVPADSARQALDHIWRLLTPGGTAVLTICVEGQPGAETDPTHVNVVDRSWWHALIADQGFAQDDDAVAELKRFHLFRSHRGVFVLRKP